ncbi:hypothetical protein FNV64_01875 [Streptomyces sp. S1A1-7]|uniref:hypothetical protein n=1 Tax=Streptomyces sp. S1A1-7 TaxID=2594459 RepID=UPI0011632612|nr:hypothetical protein [Streptomyces sp. S1A1-7]QDN74630.1 hypothetical protein FNV64_01875 [Streptomyces sp. S1A1-7]
MSGRCAGFGRLLALVVDEGLVHGALPAAVDTAVFTRQFGSESPTMTACPAQRVQRHRNGPLPLVTAGAAAAGSLPVSRTTA